MWVITQQDNRATQYPISVSGNALAWVSCSPFGSTIISRATRRGGDKTPRLTALPESFMIQERILGTCKTTAVRYHRPCPGDFSGMGLGPRTRPTLCREGHRPGQELKEHPGKTR